MSSAGDLGYAVHTPDHPKGTHCRTVAEVQEIVRAYRDAHGENAVARDITVHRMVEGSVTGQQIGDARDFI